MPVQSLPAQSLPVARPEDIGLSATRLGRIAEALERDIAAGKVPGAVVGIMRGGKVAHLAAVGKRDPGTGAALSTDAIFSIASMTKPMTSVALMMLHEEGRVLLADPISTYLPALKGLKVATSLSPERVETRAAAREPTVQDVLRHTAGFTYSDRGASAAHKMHPGGGIKGMLAKSKDETLAQLAAAPLLFDPGSSWEYGFSTDVAGFIVEAVSGKSLGAFLKERLWGPLGMVDTAFNVPAEKVARYAHCLPNDPLTGKPQAIHHAMPHDAKWDSGGGGAVSTVTDYLRFADMLRAGGRANGQQLLGRGTVRLMTSDHLPAGFGARIADSMDPASTGPASTGPTSGSTRQKTSSVCSWARSRA
jgi:CubicO group peptidase (beta-lactamase class C family)